MWKRKSDEEDDVVIRIYSPYAYRDADTLGMDRIAGKALCEKYDIEPGRVCEIHEFKDRYVFEILAILPTTRTIYWVGDVTTYGPVVDDEGNLKREDPIVVYK